MVSRCHLLRHQVGPRSFILQALLTTRYVPGIVLGKGNVAGNQTVKGIALPCGLCVTYLMVTKAMAENKGAGDGAGGSGWMGRAWVRAGRLQDARWTSRYLMASPAVSNPVAARMFKTCSSRLFSQGH